MSKKVSLNANQDLGDNWIPGDAFKIANDFRSKNGNDLSPELITQLLRSLNQLWRDREKKQISRIKAKCQEEVNAAKRVNHGKYPYVEVQLRKHIGKL